MKLGNPFNRQEPLSMTVLMMGGLIVFLLWAALFEIEQSVRAQGQLIPSARTQVIQAADGGVLSKILVQEGQVVRAGQTLAVLEPDRSHAAFQESRSREAGIATALVRAEAETSGRAPDFGGRFKAYPEFVAAQKALYEQRRRTLQEELASLNDNLSMAKEELRLSEALLKNGDIGRIEVLRSQRQVSELHGRISAVRNKYLQDARTEAARLADELSSNRYKIEEKQNVLEHTELTTPVDGVVKYLRVTTIGGVLRSGDELMQISPTADGMLVEVKLNPVDIGQLHIGLPVSVKFDAFDYAVYGSLKGTLSYISSDTLTEQGGAAGQASTYYRAHVRLDPIDVEHNPKLAKVDLKPGMTTSVDIRTDSRSVLQYLAKPIFKAFSGAMNER